MEDVIRMLLEASPFEPFTIHMAGRTSYDIPRPEGVSFSPHGGALYIHTGDQLRCILSLDHVVSVETIIQPLIRKKA